MDDLLAARSPALERDAGGCGGALAQWRTPRAGGPRRLRHTEVDEAPARAVYELGMRERDDAMAIQSNLDG